MYIKQTTEQVAFHPAYPQVTAEKSETLEPLLAATLRHVADMTEAGWVVNFQSEWTETRGMVYLFDLTERTGTGMTTGIWIGLWVEGDDELLDVGAQVGQVA